VLAPRYEVAQNWIKEYETFVNVHYKLDDDIVRSSIGSKAIIPAIYCDNLYHLIENLQDGWGRFFVGKISSFSSLLSKKERTNERLENLGIRPDQNYNIDTKEKDEKLVFVRGIASQLRIEAAKYLENNKFDLVIIDESHYFRNRNGQSLRVNAAEKFFGANQTRISKKSLLLTATPNHSSSDNIKAIVSYFDDGKYQDADYQNILDDTCLRRFRRLSSHGKVKYNYRKEEPQRSDFENDELSELFFGIYQKQLVTEFIKEKQHGSKRNMLGFLEGTEFIPRVKETEKNKGELREGHDYHSGFDGKLLLKLSKQYKEVFNDYPRHPKYSRLVDDLISPGHNLRSLNTKKLVFVRRIPSVREIAARCVHRYDDILLEKISKALGVKLRLNVADFRKYFERKISRVLSKSELEADDAPYEISGEKLDENIEGIPSSFVLDLFKRQKKAKGVVASTHASNFRLRFSRY